MTHPIHSADAERAAFEAEVRKINSRDNVLERWPDGSYKHHGTDGRWEGWQLARAAAQVGANGAADQFKRVGKCVAMKDSGIIVATAITPEWADKIVAHSLAAGAPAETAPEYVPIYKNIIDHNGKITGVEWVNAADAMKVSASGAPAETPKPVALPTPYLLSNQYGALFNADQMAAYRTTPAATIGAGEGKDALDAARWRFMMRVSDDENGPESAAMEKFADEMFETDRPKSEQLSELVDRAAAAMRSKTSPGEAG